MSQEKFDEAAATWDDMPERRELAAAIVAAIKQEVDLVYQNTTLEIGCGTGKLIKIMAKKRSAGNGWCVSWAYVLYFCT